MSPEPLVTVEELQGLLASGHVCLFDCRHNLLVPSAGREAWLAGHIPGSVHADMDLDLSAAVTPGSGRHPLPAAGAFAGFLARSGWRPGMPVVAYDAQGGALAARLWWLMRYFGQPGARLLDGGLAAWQADGLPLREGDYQPRAQLPVQLYADNSMVVGQQELRQALDEGAMLLADARAADRFAGENETIDPVAGHVPGAISQPFSHNLDSVGCFKPAEVLRERYLGLLDGHSPRQLAHMCGSGVTACHNALAMELAGLPGSRLYAGSWSEWITNADNPVATGSE
jgi:thiosulfate/3-mercaptopyruvate sulfurtransferase